MQLISQIRPVARRILMYPGAWLYRRLSPQVRVIGITGSVGKTTTKEVTVAMLSQFGATTGSLRSENHRISVAETLLGMRWRHRYNVIELSASKPGYLDLPLQMARPDIGVLTLIGRDHYSAFKSLEAIADEKGKVITRLPGKGVAVLNIDDPLVRAIGEKCKQRIIWVGQAEGATLRLLEARSCWPQYLSLTVEYQGTLYEVPTRLHGEHFALSVLSALGIAIALGIPLPKAIDAIIYAEPAEGRMQVVAHDDGVAFVRDDWKASHWALGASFTFMASALAKRKIVVIGTVSDSSQGPSRRYSGIARDARKFADIAIFIGPNSSAALKARKNPDDKSVLAFHSLHDASRHLNSILRSGDLVLLKGTNPSDHLIRLILARKGSIACWRTNCRLHAFCDRCDQLQKATEQSTVARHSADGYDAPVEIGAIDTASPNRSMLIVGLGNPGTRYINTPHNLGFAVIDRFAESTGASWQRVENGFAASVEINTTEISLFKPDVSINLSGPVVKNFLESKACKVSSTIVAHDDVDLKLGQVKSKSHGGPAGHNGILSIMDALATGDFERLRIGGRRPGDDRPSLQIVLETYSADDASLVSAALDLAVKALFSRCEELTLSNLKEYDKTS